MRTLYPKINEIKTRNFYLIDATDKILGRLASKIASILRGKHKTIYTPGVDVGDFVIVINANKIKLTGKKEKKKLYYRHSGYPGGLKIIPYLKLKEKHPERIIYLAVKRMLPSNKLRKIWLRRLKIYADSNHPHSAQKPMQLPLC